MGFRVPLRVLEGLGVVMSGVTSPITWVHQIRAPFRVLVCKGAVLFWGPKK